MEVYGFSIVFLSIWTLAAVLLAVFLWSWVLNTVDATSRLSNGRANSPDMATLKERAAFLFKAGMLVDADGNGLQLLAQTSMEAVDWLTLRRYLAPRFPDFPVSQGARSSRDFSILSSQDPSDSTLVTLDQWDDMARVSVLSDTTHHSVRRTEILEAMFQAPNPIWKLNTMGTVVWRNQAYKTLEESLGHLARTTGIFDVRDLTPDAPPRRVVLVSEDGNTKRWFDVTAVRADKNTMYYATDADALVSALKTQHSYVQTFSKTFAQLSVGLAIFDKTQKLILFNPALVQLTGLGTDFLSNRCDLKGFFDQLREHHVVPSQSGSFDWHLQISELMRAARAGRYSDTWTLPSGVTYRVTGRPHPDGALAFLFEDITAEISITRRFRAEIEQCHHILDTVPNAMVLFASTGKLQFCNQAYRNLWRTDPDTTMADYTLRDAVSLWQSECSPNDFWPALRQRVLSTTDRHPWRKKITTKNGQVLTLDIKPISGGTTLVSFENTVPNAHPLADAIQTL